LGDHELRDDPGKFVDRLGGGVDQGFGFLMRLVLHDLLDAAPLLEIGRLGDAEQRDAAAGVLGTARGEAHGDAAFRRLVDHDQEFARTVEGGLAHGRRC
jgi:hypothetical protein